MPGFKIGSTVGAVGLAVLAAIGCEKTPPDAMPMTVKAKALQPERVEFSMRFSATVEPRQKVDLAFKVPGTVDHLYRVKTSAGERDVQEGDLVPKGEVIAELELRDYQREVELGQSRLDRALAAIRAAEANAELARREYERFKGLVHRESATQKELDDAKSRTDAADAQVLAAQKDAAGASVALAQAKDRLSDCTLRVPIDQATVVSKSIDPKERVVPNQVVFRIMDISTVHVEFGVPDTLLGTAPRAGGAATKVSLGQELEVYADAFEGEKFRGRVTKIAPAANPATRTFLTEVTLDNAHGRLKAGMILTVRLGHDKEAVLVPMTAIQRGTQSGETAVYKIEEQGGKTIAKRRRVSLGGLYNNQVEVLPAGSEVKVGDRIVVTGASRLHEGREVHIIQDDQEKAQP